LSVREGHLMSTKREVIPLPVRTPDTASSSGQPVSMAVRGGDFLFVSGLTAIDLQSGKYMQGTTASETRQILTNLKQLLDAAGSSIDKVVKVNVLLHSMLEAPNMNEVYARFFPDQPPARTVCGARLPDGVKVIVECTALA
jgi:2-iminobutanoate/2-iminopropanoate deaminase